MSHMSPMDGWACKRHTPHIISLHAHPHGSRYRQTRTRAAHTRRAQTDACTRNIRATRPRHTPPTLNLRTRRSIVAPDAQCDALATLRARGEARGARLAHAMAAIERNLLWALHANTATARARAPHRAHAQMPDEHASEMHQLPSTTST